MSEVKLYNDDALKILKTIPRESVDLIISDIPYRITSKGGNSNMGGMYNKLNTRKGLIFDNNCISPKDFMTDLYKVLKDGTHCYLMINNCNLIELLNEGIKVGFHFVNYLQSKDCKLYELFRK